MNKYISLTLVLIITGISMRIYVEFSNHKHFGLVEKRFDDDTNSILKQLNASIEKVEIDLKNDVHGDANNQLWIDQLNQMKLSREVFINSRNKLKSDTKEIIIGGNFLLR